MTQGQAVRARPGTPPRHLRWGGFAVASFALFVLLLGSNIPTPLFPLSARTYGLSPLGVTLLFATYTLLVIPAVLLFGAFIGRQGTARGPDRRDHRGRCGRGPLRGGERPLGAVHRP